MLSGEGDREGGSSGHDPHKDIAQSLDKLHDYLELPDNP